jgi:BirA family biotin operon repressor/biotin-[acetyl-CoA-carboxylase] ligase
MSQAELQLEWDPASLQHLLAPAWPGLQLEVVAQTGSTNTDLLAWARIGNDGASARLRVAEHQTAGRGRQGKAWASAVGSSLTFSLALPLAPADWSGLSLAVGLALAEALEPAPSARGPLLRLKWPNDLLLRAGGPDDGAADLGRKLGGILIETVAGATAGAPRIAVIGIGLNLLPTADDAPSPERPWGRANLAALWPGVTAPAALACVAPPLLRALRAFEQHGFAPLQAGYAQRDALAGQPVSTTLRELPQGVADGTDAQGALWLRTPDGQRRPLISGEVSLRPVAPGVMPC